MVQDFFEFYDGNLGLFIFSKKAQKQRKNDISTL